jgi:hypothetical protein
MLRPRRILLRVAALLLALVCVTTVPSFAAAATVAFTIRDSRITKSSGLARDLAGKRYWTVNDSGDPGTAYALNSRGAVTGTLRYRAKPIDVEAVATFGSRLYLADIGDKARSRQFVTIYFFDRAKPASGTVPYRSYDFAYPDGKHDAETLLVDGTGRLYIVTKGKKGGIYAAPGQPSRQALNRLFRVGAAPAYVTDGVFLPGDRKIALRTYVSVDVVDAISYRTVARAATPKQPQGESIAVGLDGSSLLVGSEGTASKVYVMKVPTRLGKVPKAGSNPPQTPTPSPTPSASPADPGDEDQLPSAGPSRRGTLLALGLAAALAVVAGVVAAVVRKRP